MKDTRFSINYSNNFSFSKPSNLPHKKQLRYKQYKLIKIWEQYHIRQDKM